MDYKEKKGVRRIILACVLLSIFINLFDLWHQSNGKPSLTSEQLSSIGYGVNVVQDLRLPMILTAFMYYILLIYKDL